MPVIIIVTDVSRGGTHLPPAPIMRGRYKHKVGKGEEEEIKRKAMLLVGAMVLVLVLVGEVALAAIITCTDTTWPRIGALAKRLANLRGAAGLAFLVLGWTSWIQAPC
jgi:hypothetical protein